MGCGKLSWECLLVHPLRGSGLCFFLLFFEHRNLGTTLSNLVDEQTIAPLLITRRVASQSALTSNAIVSGDPGSINFRSPGESTTNDKTLTGGTLTSLMDVHGEIARELGAGAEATADKLAP